MDSLPRDRTSAGDVRAGSSDETNGRPHERPTELRNEPPAEKVHQRPSWTEWFSSDLPVPDWPRRHAVPADLLALADAFGSFLQLPEVLPGPVTGQEPVVRLEPPTGEPHRPAAVGPPELAAALR